MTTIESLTLFLMGLLLRQLRDFYDGDVIFLLVVPLPWLSPLRNVCLLELCDTYEAHLCEFYT